MTLLIFVLATTALFLSALLVQSVGRIKFCAACVAISLTWVALLTARALGLAVNPLWIGVLMGESIVGLYYLLEKRVPAEWQLFRWPYLITLTVLVYLAVGVRDGAALAIASLALLWIMFGGIYAYQRYPLIKKVAARLIACCRDW